jgi:hypothetical protein
MLDEQWSLGVAAVRAFAAENGHANVPKEYVAPNGHKTGQWAARRRQDYASGHLSADRVAELESIPGWVWNKLDGLWAAGVAAVHDYTAAHGHARVPRDYMSPSGHRTGVWVSSRRREFSVGTLSGARITELESIPGWVWNPHEQRSAGVAAVHAYAAENGHANVPNSYVSPNGHGTGQWVSKRRRDYASGTLSADQVAELEAIPGWLWSPLAEMWAAGVAAVRAYATENGHARIPRSYVSPDGHRTGVWVSARRVDYAVGRITPDRIAELESIPGWVWGAR